MRRFAIPPVFMVSLLIVCAIALPASAQTLNSLYDDAGAQADSGASLLADADWQFRDGNVQDGCRIMEQARVHYEQAYNDLNAMEDMVNDPANDYSDSDREKTTDWIRQQRDTSKDIGDKMAETYFAKCQ